MKKFLLDAALRVQGYLGMQKPWVAALSALAFVLYAGWPRVEGVPAWGTVVMYERDAEACYTGVVTDEGAALRRAGCYVPVGERVCVVAQSLPDFRARVWYWTPSDACDGVR